MMAVSPNVEHREPSLEERLTLNVSTNDAVLKSKLEILPQSGFEPVYTSLSDLVKADVARPVQIYLIDFLNLPPGDYARVLEKIKQIRAINVESRVVALATEAQQSQENFSSFKEANGRGLVELHSRPDPNALPESLYITGVEGMASELPDFLRGLYKKPNGKLENVEVIKIGGSIFDLYTQNPDALRNLLAAIVETHKKQDLILTVGGGPLMEIPAGFRAAYQMSDTRFQESSRAQITEQALNVVDLLQQIEPGIAAYLPPEFVITALRDGWITREFLQNKIPVFSYLPAQSVEIGIPPIPYATSDTHAVMFADKLGTRKIIFAKNTDGIYLRDPNLPKSFWQHLRPPFRESTNPRLDFIYAHEIQDRIERMGLNQRGQLTDEHLIETRAIQPFIQSSNLYVIQVINGTKPLQLVDAMNGIKVGSYIIK
mgnify:FL=1